MIIRSMHRLVQHSRHAAAAVAISLITAGGVSFAQPAAQPGGDDEPRAREGDQDEQPDPDREPRRDRERRQGDRPSRGRGDQPPRPVDRIPRNGRPRQPGPGGGFPGVPFGMFPDPLREALDSNRDGSLDADEIAAAAESLKALDKDGDGSLSGEELRPALPGPFGPGGGFGGQGRGPGPGLGGESGFDDTRGPGRGPGFGGGQGPGGPFGGRPSPDALVDRLMGFDEDGDGMLSRDEATAFAEEFLQRLPMFNSPGMPGGQPFQGQRQRQRFQGQGFPGPGGQGFERRPPPADGSPRTPRPQRPEPDGE